MKQKINIFINKYSFEKWLTLKCIEILKGSSSNILKLDFNAADLKIFINMNLHTVWDIIQYMNDFILNLCKINYNKFKKFIGMIGQCKINGQNQLFSHQLKNIKQTGYFIFYPCYDMNYQKCCVEALLDEALQGMTNVLKSNIVNIYKILTDCKIKEPYSKHFWINLIKESEHLSENIINFEAIKLTNLFSDMLFSQISIIKSAMEKQHFHIESRNKQDETFNHDATKHLFQLSTILDNKNLLNNIMHFTNKYGFDETFCDQTNTDCIKGFKGIQTFLHNERILLTHQLNFSSENLRSILSQSNCSTHFAEYDKKILLNNIQLWNKKLAYANLNTEILPHSFENHFSKKERIEHYQLQKQKRNNILYQTRLKRFKHRNIMFINNNFFKISQHIKRTNQMLHSNNEIFQTKAFNLLLRPQMNHTIHISDSYYQTSLFFNSANFITLLTAIINGNAYWQQSYYMPRVKNIANQYNSLNEKLNELTYKLHNIADSLILSDFKSITYYQLLQEYIIINDQKEILQTKVDKLKLIIEFSNQNKEQLLIDHKWKPFWTKPENNFGTSPTTVQKIRNAFGYVKLHFDNFEK